MTDKKNEIQNIHFEDKLNFRFGPPNTNQVPNVYSKYKLAKNGQK